MVVIGSISPGAFTSTARSLSKSATQLPLPNGVGVRHFSCRRTPHAPAVGSQKNSSSLSRGQARLSVNTSMRSISTRSVPARFPALRHTI